MIALNKTGSGRGALRGTGKLPLVKNWFDTGGNIAKGCSKPKAGLWSMSQFEQLNTGDDGRKRIVVNPMG
jgi:hypothetical protein